MTSTSSPERVRELVVAAIVKTAPDVADDIDDLDDEVDLFEEYGLDSMDRLNIMTAITEATGIDIPDERYPQLTTMSALVAHVS